MTLEEKSAAVCSLLSAARPVLIAYSGGVDSTVLLALAAETLGAEACAIIADSPSLPRQALIDAISVAEGMGVTPVVLATEELANPDYANNPPNRCYFCKAELFSKMETYARTHGFRSLAYGENADDMRQVRPGRAAAEAFAVLAPLRDAGLNKQEIRALAKARSLPNWSAPAQPCLSSRIPHGVPVTADALARIEAAEAAVRALDFAVFRVRHVSAPGTPPAARLEIAVADLARATADWDRLETGLRHAGFVECELDPNGYRTTAAA